MKRFILKFVLFWSRKIWLFCKHSPAVRSIFAFIKKKQRMPLPSGLAVSIVFLLPANYKIYLNLFRFKSSGTKIVFASVNNTTPNGISIEFQINKKYKSLTLH